MNYLPELTRFIDAKVSLALLQHGMSEAHSQALDVIRPSRPARDSLRQALLRHADEAAARAHKNLE